MARPPVIPERYAQAVAWCLGKLPRWTANQAVLTLTDAQLDRLDALSNAAETARRDLAAARLASRGAALRYRTSVAAMREEASHLVAQIRVAADMSEQPALVYEAAGIAAPKPRRPRPAPGTPRAFSTDIEPATGALTIRFDCPHPRGLRGVVYRVERAVWREGDGAHEGDDSAGDFTFLTIARGRTFTDETIPAGTALVAYRVTALSATKEGAPAVHWVRLAGEGVVVASALPTRNRGQTAAAA